MAGVRIVTDSACDLRDAVTSELGIAVVPLSIRFGSEEYTDRVDLTVEQFYEKMAATDALPETAAPAPGAFAEAFTAAADDGADAIICINISSELSATMQSATSAANDLGDRLPIIVFDSQSITMGLGTQVLEAAKAAADGATTDAIIEMLTDLRERTRVFGALDSLDNLKKGGRIGGAQAMIGTMLSIKPTVDISTGKVEEAAKHRTRRKSLTALRDRVAADGAVEHLAVLHANAGDIDEFLDLMSERYDRDSIHVDLIGPVIGTHAGAGTMGACWVVPA
ncbi:MAG: DegV family protein [Acidimicrobiales bacterium]|nr:DegV family protein [Acidimicrobiales bacterium]MCB1261895.1 DegV family protein [Acidimicrobiales bacterium]